MARRRALEDLRRLVLAAVVVVDREDGLLLGWAAAHGVEEWTGSR